MPLVGLGEGRGDRFAGEVIAAQVNRALAVLRRTPVEVDFAILTAGADRLAAAQQGRRLALEDSGNDGWIELTPTEFAQGDELASLARRGGLVLFVGSGVSSAAGLPSWTNLLMRLAVEAELDWEVDLKDLNLLDRARMIRRKLPEERFADVMTEMFGSRQEQGLPHQLLASLPVLEAATTNYDTLFEDAWRFRKREVAVLPRKKALTEPRWLLKLHGSIEDPSSIVLSRDDYLRMDREGTALSGLVQALLITRRMLFIGYSLDDDRFHRIAHDALAAIGSADERPGSEPFAVALSPVGKPSMKSLWEGDIDILDMSGEGDLAAGARRIEIFLDYVLAHSDDPAAYMHSDTFEALWSPTEKELALVLEEALELADGKNAGPAAASVARHLRGFADPPANH